MGDNIPKLAGRNITKEKSKISIDFSKTVLENQIYEYVIINIARSDYMNQHILELVMRALSIMLELIIRYLLTQILHLLTQ